MAKLSLCRTAALGSRHYECSKCGQKSVAYHSCGDRHCPTCSGAKRIDWMDSASQLILDSVTYYQVVFTLPGDLSSLALGNRKVIYNLLFQSAWSALKQTIASEQGYAPAALMVLHTWNQRLDAHAHVHAVVQGGGPAVDGTGWRSSRHKTELNSVDRYLVDAVALRRSYRDHFLRGLERLHAAGKLQLAGEFAYLRDAKSWLSFIDRIKSCEWVSHIEPPPRGDCCAQNVLKYLARYLTGGPISDSRIVSANDTRVTFLAREGKQSGGTAKQIPVTLSTVEFTRRWSLHVLPKGYTKTRRFGGWSNARCADYIKRCQDALAEMDAILSPEHQDDSADCHQPVESTTACGRACSCGAPLILQEETYKPSWSDVMNSSDRPLWYQRL